MKKRRNETEIEKMSSMKEEIASRQIYTVLILQSAESSQRSALIARWIVWTAGLGRCRF